MSRIVPFVIGVSLLAVSAAPAAAQSKAQLQPPQPAAGPVAEALGAWNEIGRKLIAMAEDFPEAKYDYKPTPEVRSFSAALLHIAGVNYMFTNAVSGTTLGPAVDDPPRQEYKAKADIVAFLKKSFADGAALMKKKGDAGMSRPTKHPFANRLVSPFSLWMDGVEHSGEHYGQLVVYYRLNGLVPPESRPRK